MSVTKQGIRDLNGKQRNGRVADKTMSCFHTFEHSRYGCPGCLSGHLTRCIELCSKCGWKR